MRITTTVVLVALSLGMAFNSQAKEITGSEADRIETDKLEEQLRCIEALGRIPKASPNKRILFSSGHLDKNADRTRPVFFCLFGNKNAPRKDEVVGLRVINHKKHLLSQEDEELLAKLGNEAQFPPSVLLIDPPPYLLNVELD